MNQRVEAVHLLADPEEKVIESTRNHNVIDPVGTIERGLSVFRSHVDTGVMVVFL